MESPLNQRDLWRVQRKRRVNMEIVLTRRDGALPAFVKLRGVLRPAQERGESRMAARS